MNIITRYYLAKQLMKTFIKNNGFYFLGIILLIIVWEVVSVASNNAITFPSIGVILKSLGEIITIKNSYLVFLYTILRLLISILASILIASFLAYFARRSNVFKKIITPIITIIKTTPVVSFIIILIVLIGHDKSSIIVSFLITLPILYEGFYNAYNSINSDIKDEIKLLSNTNFYVIKNIFIPIMMPHIITSLLQSVSLGIKSLVMAELITQPKYSIGRELLQYRNSLDMGGIMAWTIILIVVMIAFELLLNKYKNKIENRL